MDETQFKSVLGFIEAGKAEGARLVAGGAAHGDKGYFVQPTVFADVIDSHKIAREEIFGPVMSVLKFSTYDEAIDRANGSIYGLAAAVMTKDIDRAITLSCALRSGVVWVNTYNVLECQTPFGGYKQSGVGRELGDYGLQQYSEVKSIIIKLSTKNS